MPCHVSVWCHTWFPGPGTRLVLRPYARAPGSCIKWCLLSDNLQYLLETSKACSLSLVLLCYVVEVLIVSHGQVGLASYPDSFEWPGYKASVWPCETIEVYHLGFNMLKQQPSQATVLPGWGRHYHCGASLVCSRPATKKEREAKGSKERGPIHSGFHSTRLGQYVPPSFPLWFYI